METDRFLKPLTVNWSAAAPEPFTLVTPPVYVAVPLDETLTVPAVVTAIVPNFRAWPPIWVTLMGSMTSAVALPVTVDDPPAARQGDAHASATVKLSPNVRAHNCISVPVKPALG